MNLNYGILRDYKIHWKWIVRLGVLGQAQKRRKDLRDKKNQNPRYVLKGQRKYRKRGEVAPKVETSQHRGL